MFTPEDLLRKAIEDLESFNFTNFFGRVLSEGDNNISHVIIAGAILNMTHYMYNDTSTFLPGVPTPYPLGFGPTVIV